VIVLVTGEDARPLIDSPVLNITNPDRYIVEAEARRRSMNYAIRQRERPKVASIRVGHRSWQNLEYQYANGHK
jgi:hypothetical protein